MQGLYDIYDTMNSYIRNDIWNDNPASIDSIQNIEYLKILPEYYYDNFLNDHLLDIIYNQENLTLEYNPFDFNLKDNNLTFIKSTNLFLGAQLIFTPYAMTTEESTNFQNIAKFYYSSQDEITNGKQMPQKVPIKDNWKKFIANQS